MSNMDTRDIGLAPHLQFTMSDRMHDYVYTTCEKARECDLYRHKPRAAKTAAVVVADNGATIPSATALHTKSAQMLAQLDSYEHEQRHRAMREVREALPITAYRSEICETIERNEVTVLVAATGSGACVPPVICALLGLIRFRIQENPLKRRASYSTTISRRIWVAPSTSL
jgi:hypothetical protein